MLRNLTESWSISKVLAKKKKKDVLLLPSKYSQSFPDSSVGKESACNAGDPGSTLRSRRSAGEGTGYPLQSSWACLVTQLVKNLPAMRETWV